MNRERAARLIEQLELAPHPEGGHFREVYRSAAGVLLGGDRRSAMTVIYYLLGASERSTWHRVRSDECWQFVEGDPLHLRQVRVETREVTAVTLAGLPAGGCPTHIVPGGAWQAARTAGAYSLVTCTVAPGFEFADFELINPDGDTWKALSELDLHAEEYL